MVNLTTSTLVHRVGEQSEKYKRTATIMKFSLGNISEAKISSHKFFKLLFKVNYHFQHILIEGDGHA